MRESFFQFLQKNKIERVVERAQSSDKNNAVSYYHFRTIEDLESFLTRYGLPNKNTNKVWDPRYHQQIALRIDDTLRAQIKQAYEHEQRTQSPPLTPDQELDFLRKEQAQIEQTLKKIAKNDNELRIKQHGGKIDLEKPGQAPRPDQLLRSFAHAQAAEISRIQKGAALLRNTNNDGWWFYNAAHAADLMFNLYYSKNYTHLSEEERLLFEDTKQLLFSREKGKVHGLKADARFFEYISSSAHLVDQRNEIHDETLRGVRARMYMEDIGYLLDGGERIRLNEYSRKGLTSLAPQQKTAVLEKYIGRINSFPMQKDIQKRIALLSRQEEWECILPCEKLSRKRILPLQADFDISIPNTMQAVD